MPEITDQVVTLEVMLQARTTSKVYYEPEAVAELFCYDRYLAAHAPPTTVSLNQYITPFPAFPLGLPVSEN
jgi:hypothetical protein